MRTWRRPSRKASSYSTAMRMRRAPLASWRVSTTTSRRSTRATSGRRPERSTTRFSPNGLPAASTLMSFSCRSGTGSRFSTQGWIRTLRIPGGIRLQGGTSEFTGRLVFLDRRGFRRDHLQQEQGDPAGGAKVMARYSRSALEGRNQLQDFRLRAAVRTVVHVAQVVRAGLLEKICQSKAARLRFPRAAV